MIRVACMGAGYFSRFHYDSWARMAGVQLVGSCNRTIEGARATGLPAFDDLRKMLEDTRPDVLDIILPPIAHFDAIRTAVTHGIKTIICQKPFCQSLEEAKDAVSLAKSAGARIIVHENFRFQPWYRDIKQHLDNGMIGAVQQLTFRLRPGDGQGPNAYLDRQPYFQHMKKFLVHETAVHWVDTFRFLLGDPISVYADLRQVNPAIKGEDAGFIVFDHGHGVRSLFDANRCLDHASDNLRRTMGEALVEGLRGSLRLLGDGSVWHREHGQTSETCLLAPSSVDGFGGDCVHHLQCHVISALEHKTPLENLAETYLAIIEIENAIYSSAETGQKIKLE